MYITVNNILTNIESAALPEYLEFLQTTSADGIIIQDLGIIQSAKRMGISIPIHASVMMNAHNLESFLLLQELGVVRVIIGKEITLSEIKFISGQTNLELECFVHGDMCFSQNSQCYFSGMLFGKSSNRGRCMKPCRWPFKLIDRTTQSEITTYAPGPYLLALKDLCLLPYLPEIFDAGVCSLKIEGRMREAGYLSALIRIYRNAIDRYSADPFGYSSSHEEFQELIKMRIRDFTPFFAFGNPGPTSIGYTGEREPRSFSNAVRQTVINDQDIQVNPLPKPPSVLKQEKKPLLSIKVGSKEAAVTALEHGADVIYTSGEAFRGCSQPWQFKDYAELIALGKQLNKRIIIGTPRITMPTEMGRVHNLLHKLQELMPDGILATNLGTIYAAAKSTQLPLFTDYSCNITNREAAALLKKYRVVQITASLEFCYEEILSMLEEFPLPVEAVIHGTLPVMVSDHCLAAALCADTTKYQVCPHPCREKKYSLQDSAGQSYPIEIDYNCRNHIFLANELALLPYLRSLYGSRLQSFRLEIPTYALKEVAAVTEIYRNNLDQLWQDPDNYQFSGEDWTKLLRIRKGHFGTGHYTQGVKVKDEYLYESKGY